MLGLRKVLLVTIPSRLSKAQQESQLTSSSSLYYTDLVFMVKDSPTSETNRLTVIT